MGRGKKNLVLLVDRIFGLTDTHRFVRPCLIYAHYFSDCPSALFPSPQPLFWVPTVPQPLQLLRSMLCSRDKSKRLDIYIFERSRDQMLENKICKSKKRRNRCGFIFPIFTIFFALISTEELYVSPKITQVLIMENKIRDYLFILCHLCGI